MKVKTILNALIDARDIKFSIREDTHVPSYHPEAHVDFQTTQLNINAWKVIDYNLGLMALDVANSDMVTLPKGLVRVKIEFIPDVDPVPDLTCAALDIAFQAYKKKYEAEILA
jgi:hypothetical protein